MEYALIGCGRIAANHIKAAVDNRLHISAVCDVKPEAMEQLLAKHSQTVYRLQAAAGGKRDSACRHCHGERPPRTDCLGLH